MENQLRKLTLGLHCVSLHSVSAPCGSVSHHPLVVFGVQDGVGLRGPAVIEEFTQNCVCSSYKQNQQP